MLPAGSDDLLQHASWLRTLARRLVADAHTADDLVQSTWLAALKNPPPTGPAGRRWLATALRNFAHQFRRSAARRRERETLVARSESTHPDLPAELALQRTLLGAVESLSEPYRTTLYRRYYENLPPRRIAALDGVSVKTVKTRLARGLAQLRARLDDEFGERGAWLALFQPWLGEGYGPTILGVSLMSAKTMSVLAAATILCVLLAGWRLRSAARADDSGTGPVPLAEIVPASLQVPVPGVSEAPNAREALAPAASNPEPLIDGAFVHGRVLDLEERPVDGIGVWSAPRAESNRAGREARSPDAWTESDGTFAVAMPTESEAEVVARDARYVTVLAADLWTGIRSARPLVIVAPRVRLAGRVLDAAGRPVGAARVWTEVDPGLRRRLTSIVDTASELRGATRKCDASARFELDDAPGVAGILKAWAPGFAELALPIPASSRDDLELRLVAAADDELILRGRVLDALGRPVEGAWISSGSYARSGSDGGFLLRVSGQAIPEQYVLTEGSSNTWRRVEPFAEIVAVSPGHLPARLALPELEQLRTLVQQGEVLTLTLGEEPLAIRGWVRDVRGRPIAGAEVWPLDPVLVDCLPASEEDEPRGTSLEALMRGGPDAERVRTEEDGSFVLGGLLERDYRLAAFHKGTMRFTSCDALRAGASDVVLELCDESRCAPVRGRVLSLDGDPLADMYVFPIANDGLIPVGERQVTDADGRFAFGSLSASVASFSAFNQDTFGLANGQGGGQELEIRVQRRCRIQVRSGAFHADAYQVLDGSGTVIQMWQNRGPHSWSSFSFELVDGRSDQVCVPETARTVVLTSKGREVARQELALDPTRLVVVRF